MSFELETAANPAGLQRVVIEPVSRVERYLSCWTATIR